MLPKTSVLFLIPSLVANGAERQLCELVRHLDRERFTVHVVVFYGPEPGAQAGPWFDLAGLQDLNLHCLHKRRGARGYLTALPRLLALLLRVQPDIVHGYMDGNLPILLLGRLLRRRVVWGIRRSSRDLTKLDRLSLRMLRVEVRLARFVDLVIFNSEAGRASYRAMGMKAERMEVVANGFDVERFRPDPAGGAAQRLAWGVAADVPLIGVVGRLHPVKDHPTFLRAAARLALEWPRAMFVCVGEGTGQELGRLRALAASQGLAGRVLFPGACGGMVAAYNALTCLVLASTDEGFPNVLGEAMACGIPCVTTRVGDAESLVGTQGIVVPVGDDLAMARGVSCLLGETAQARAARSESARSRICARFSVQALARNTEARLLDLVPSPAATCPDPGRP